MLASSIVSGVVCNNCINWYDKTVPHAETKTKTLPNIIEITVNISGIFSFSWLPKFFAIKTERPNVNPVIIVMKKLIGVVVEPMAANEISPFTFPTIKASTQL